MKNLLSALVVLSSIVAPAAFARSPIPTLQLEETEKNIESVVELRSFHNGAVRMFLHDNEEPAARPMEVTIVVPNGDQEGGFIDLKTYSLSSYCSADLKNAKATYDSSQGLTVKIAVSFYNPENGRCEDKDTLNVNVKLLPQSMSQTVAWLTSGRRN